MKYYEFSEDDKFINTFKAFPQFNHYAVSGNVFFNSLPHFSGTINSSLTDILQQGPLNEGISLYEYNVDRLEVYIEQFAIKEGAGTIGFKSEANAYNFTPSGNRLYHKARGPLTASISRSFDSIVQSPGGGVNHRTSALVTAARKYRFLSPHFDIISNPYQHNALISKMTNLIYIPSIFYGSTIKRGTVKLDFYFTGSLVGTLEDTGGRGELIQTVGDTGTGEVAGIIFYDEGVMMLTGSWDINTNNSFQPGQNELSTNPRWIHYFNSINDEAKFAPFPDATLSNISCSFGLSYQGVQNTECATLMAHAPAGEVNYSNNPTFYTHRPLTNAAFAFNGYSAFQSASTDKFIILSLKIPTEAGGQNIFHRIKIWLQATVISGSPDPNDIFIDARSSTESEMATDLTDAINGKANFRVTYGSNILVGSGGGIRQLYANVDPNDSERVLATLGSYLNPAEAGPGLVIDVVDPVAVNPSVPGLFYSPIQTTLYLTSSHGFTEQTAPLTNVVSSSVQNFSASYEPTTYISKIGLYDEDKNLIGIAKLAKPIKKENRDSYTFKLKYDI